MSDQLKIAKRPKEPAKNGRIVRVKVNYLEAKFNFPSVKSYSFDIDDAKRKPLKREKRDEVMAAFLKSKSPEITAAHYGSSLYSYKDILIGAKTTNYRFDHKDCLGAIQNYTVKIKFSSEINLDTAKKFIKGNSNLSWEDIQENLNVFNSYLNTKVHTMLPHLSSKSKAIFPKRQERTFLPGGSEILYGYMQSIRLGWENLYVNIDVCNTLVIPEGNLLNLLPVFLNRENFDSKNLFENEIDYLTRRLKGYKFYTTYSPRSRTITKISLESANNLKFERDGEMISVSEYYKETGTPLRYPTLPCVVVIKKQGRNEREMHFPIEVCLLKFGQKIPQSSITASMQGEMINKTSISPVNRFKHLGFAMKKHYNHNNDEYLKSIGLKVADKFVELD
ncbi:4384_t:CDS:2, partial [Diversispora eburnea]